jgi:acetyl esterase/lipase
MKSLFLSICFCITVQVSAQPGSAPLYPKDKIPFAIKGKPEPEKFDSAKGHYSVVSEPSIAGYKPTGTSKGKAVLIFPGGGYGFVSYEKEGHQVAELFSQNGYPAFALKYRLPDKRAIDSTQRQWVPLADVAAAIRWIRKNAIEFGVDTAQIGVLGFSAGGHLAASASTLFDKHPHGGKDVKPAFTGLIYPVISSGSSRHAGSYKNLLGKSQSEEQLNLFSLDKQVNSLTPPAFLVHSQDDPGVPVENSLLYFQALRAQQIPCEMHIFPTGGHGFGLGSRVRSKAPDWAPLMLKWLENLQISK